MSETRLRRWSIEPKATVSALIEELSKLHPQAEIKHIELDSDYNEYQFMYNKVFITAELKEND